MERMTSRDEDCVLVNGHALGYATIGELVQMAERLAAYEDMDSKRLRPGDTVWLSKMFYTRPKKPVPVTVDAIRCASTGSAIPVTIFSLSRQKNTTSTLETTKMPDEYISRETALMKLMQDGCSAKNLQSISDMPAADVAEVVHGEWLRADDDWNSLTTIQCSLCSEEWCFETDDDVSLLNYKYCPNCGAKMDGGNGDATD